MINGAPVNVLDFGADPTGATDSSAAFQAAVNASANVVVPKGTFLIDTAVNVADHVTIQGMGTNYISNIVTNADVNTFNVGMVCTINDIFFTHNGDGIIINAPQKESLRLEGNTFYATESTSLEPLIYVSGSFAWISQNGINNAREDAHAVQIDRTTGLIHIESHITFNTFGGAGSGIRVWSSDNSARPEGIHITDNSFTGLHENLRIEQVLEAIISDNVFDQGGGYNVIFNPVNTGVQNVQLTGNYFSTPSNQSAGVAVAHLNYAANRPLSQIGFTDNTFAFCGIGCALYAPANDITFIGNSFVSVGDTGISLYQASKCVIVGNTFGAITGVNIGLTDGASGGPFSVDANQFDSTAVNKNIFNVTNSSKFLFGQTNTGLKQCGWSSFSTNSTTSPNASYIFIPHGLQSTPDRSKILVYLATNTLQVTSGATVNVVAVDATNIEVQVFFTVFAGGTYNVNAFASI
jgi:hypothetical protein